MAVTFSGPRMLALLDHACPLTGMGEHGDYVGLSRPLAPYVPTRALSALARKRAHRQAAGHEW